MLQSKSKRIAGTQIVHAKFVHVKIVHAAAHASAEIAVVVVPVKPGEPLTHERLTTWKASLTKK